MSNVRIATIDCKSVDAVPDTLRWGFDGLTGVALLFIKGRPPRCHRCGARGHKVAECTSPRTYASTIGRRWRGLRQRQRGGETTDTSLATAESAANNQEQRPADQPTEMATADGVGDGAGVTSERPEAAATTDELMESEQSQLLSLTLTSMPLPAQMLWYTGSRYCIHKAAVIKQQIYM